MSNIKKYFDRKSKLAIAYTLIVLLGLSTIPFIYAGLLTWSNVDPTGNLNAVPAGIVNEDKGSKNPNLKLGEVLTNKLVQSKSHKNFHWKKMSAKQAQEKLEDGKIYAILWIPQEFSQNVTSISNKDIGKVKRAELKITTSDAVNMISGNIASTIATTVTDSLSSQVSDEYLHNIYTGFSTINEKVTKASDGSKQLSDGLVTFKNSSTQLVIGLRDLKSGALKLNNAMNQTKTGSEKLYTAANQLSGGISKINSGSEKLQGGLAKAYIGTTTFSEYMNELNTRAKSLPSATNQLSENSTLLARGTDNLYEVLNILNNKTAELNSGLNALNIGVKQINTNLKNVKTNVNNLSTSSIAVTSNSKSLQNELKELEQRWHELSEEEKLSTVQQLHADSLELQRNITNIDNGIKQVNSGIENIIGKPTSDTNSNATGITAISEKSETIANGVTTLKSINEEILTQSVKVKNGTQQLSEKLIELNTQGAIFTTSINQLANTSITIKENISQLHKGSVDLQEGTRELSAKTPEFVRSMGAVNDAISKIDDSSDALAQGVMKATDGGEKLVAGEEKLVLGAKDLQEGLRNGAKEIPKYSKSEIAALSDVASHPIELIKQREYEVAGYGAGLAPYFMSIALWVGALGFFLMMPVYNKRLLNSKAYGIRVAVFSYIPAAIMSFVQSLLMIIAVHTFVGIEFTKLIPGFFIAFLGSLSFMAINQALVGLLGVQGRYIALIFTGLQLSSAGATYPIETSPTFFQVLHSWLPITHVVQGFRSTISGSSYGYNYAILVLSIYILVSILVLTAGVHIKRYLDVKNHRYIIRAKVLEKLK
ncbi:YhgE/Pip domain-containing protein [Actinomyces sp. zg-332]|uniref:YhgE/Pip domain-containing protein n=1 Tax=Actinomyces sp. zg-332 TaxID=2708340 RepID=UPI0014244C3B|nr:YhgE/Pip domain-containing protein [Actinomyces sp. zg-332]QPK93949.1 YhgE/Pip domain-containing protein [Actinomyces sp. zg-332]